MTIAMGRLLILSGVICTFALTTHFYIGVYILMYMYILADQGRKDQVRSLFLPIVLIKMRYDNVNLQMRLNQGPNDDVDGHEMNKIQ